MALVRPWMKSPASMVSDCMCTSAAELLLIQRSFKNLWPRCRWCLCAVLTFQAEAIMPGFELEAEVVCPADAKKQRLWKQHLISCCQKTQPSIRRCEKGAFKRLTGIHLSRTNVLQASAMFPRSLSPERGQGSIAHKIGHAALHLSSHK